MVRFSYKSKGGYAPEKIEAEHKVIQIVIDGNMLNALKDAKALSDSDLKEMETMEHTPIEDEQEILDAEITETVDNAGDIGCVEAEEVGRDIGKIEQAEINQEQGSDIGTKEGTDSDNTETRGQEVSKENR